jgi:hypothetical protein
VVEAFGRPDVQDVEWIEAAGSNSWVVFTKDAAIRRRVAERKAVVEHGMRMVCLVHQQLSVDDSIGVIESNWNQIEDWFAKPGPWIIAVRKSGVVKVPLC